MNLATPPFEITKELDHDLYENILPYWMNKMVDHKQGGFYGRRTGHDELDEKAPKGIILNTRILWTFSSAARITDNPAYREMATRAYTYIKNNFIDKKQGGVYWMVDYQGKVMQAKKQIYAQAFAIYALTEYFMATYDKESLAEAKKLYWLMERHSFDQHENGYLEAFDQSWNLLDDLRLSEKDANEKKTMNTHLHVLEAYTNLYRVWQDAELARQLRNLILIFKEKFVAKNNHFNLFFNEHWELQSDEISFGHDIEGSWLLCEAAEVLRDKELIADMRQLALRMVDSVLEEGLDGDGGLMNESGPHGLLDTDKHWWPQAEALVGLVNAWQITGDKNYLIKAEKIWSFIKQYLIDYQHGEWHWRVNRYGDVNYKEDKAGPWKCPYHNGRALMEVSKRLVNAGQ